MGETWKYSTGMRITMIVFICLSFFLIGCKTTQSSDDAKRGPTIRLDFLENGKTTRQDVLSRIGVPSGAFEKESILTYRLSRLKNGEYHLVDNLRSWQSVHFSLVLVFDPRGVLQKSSLIPIH